MPLADAARTAATWWRDLIALPRTVAEIHSYTKELPTMSDQITETLTAVASGLRGPLTTSITALIAERDTAVARAVELGATELTQSTAADDVRTAFADVAGLLTPVAEVPDVDPLPETQTSEIPQTSDATPDGPPADTDRV